MEALNLSAKSPIETDETTYSQEASRRVELLEWLNQNARPCLQRSFFCRKNLSMSNGVIKLVDEEGEEYPTIYMARHTGFSGGWKEFAVEHGLVDGDTLGFHLIRSTAFKVYIIRVNHSEQRKHISSSES